MSASFTHEQARTLMHAAGFDKQRYFELVGHRLQRRTKAEAAIQLPCFFHGAFGVFGDSIAEELATRIAVLRGSRVTRNASRACESTDVLYKEGNGLIDLRRKLRTPIPCRLRWAWFGVGLHHLYRREQLVLNDECESYAQRVNKTDWDQFQTGYAHLSPTAIALRDAVREAFPRCWHALGARLASSKGWQRTHVTLTSILPPDPLLLLAHPAKFDWTTLWDVGVAEVWLAAQRRLVSNRTSAFDFVDLGPLAAANPGTRCDGLHFGKPLFSYQGARRREWCSSKEAAYDSVVLEWSARQRCT